MADEIDIMNVDLSEGKAGEKRAIPKEDNGNNNTIEAAPTLRFRVYYYINNQEPVSGEMEIEAQVNGMLSKEQAHRELLKHMPEYIQKNPILLKINHSQQVAKDNPTAF